MEIADDLELRVRRLITVPPYFFSEDFRSLLDELLFLQLEHGLTGVPPDESGGYSSEGHWLRFAAAVHEGWKRAQTRILGELVSRIGTIEVLEEGKREAHRARDKQRKEELKRDLTMVRAEMRTLRRFLDSICWSILDGQHHVVRRVHHAPPFPAPTVEQIRYIGPVVDEINQDPLKIAIACDATSFIHTCDLLVRDLSTRPAQTQFVEVKSGEKNLAIYQQAREAAKNGPDVAWKEAPAMSKTDLHHFQRAKRQIERALSIDEVLRTGLGKDHRTGLTVSTPEVLNTTRSFAERVMACCEQVNEQKAWAIDVVDDCLYIGAYREPRLVLGFLAWMAGQGCESPVVNILDSLVNPLCRPLPSMYLSPRVIQRLATTELTFLMCLDVPKWVSLATNALGMDVFLESKAATAKLLGGWQFDPVLCQGRAVSMRKEGEVFRLGTGVLDRIFFDFQAPLSALETQWLSTRPAAVDASG